MKASIVLNHPPYGTEHCYNALRLASALAKSDPGGEIIVFLLADAVLAAKAGQETPDGYYNVERMLKGLIARKGRVLLCGTCMNTRGLSEVNLVAGARRSTMDELAAMTLISDKVMTF